MVGHSPELWDLGKQTWSSPGHTAVKTQLRSPRPGALGTSGLPACSSQSQAGVQLLPAPRVLMWNKMLLSHPACIPTGFILWGFIFSLGAA